jgi:hypothetical protein
LAGGCVAAIALLLPLVNAKSASQLEAGGGSGGALKAA